MRSHVRVVAWLYIAHGILSALIGLGILGLLGLFARFVARAEQPAEMPLEMAPMIQTLGVAFAVLALVIAAPRLIAGFGLLSLRPWARTLTLVLATFGLIDFPIGTGVSAYAYWVLLSREGTDLFRGGGVRPEPPPLPM